MQRLWGRKISDLGFAEFINILSYKAKVIKIDRYYPSSKTCSSCGQVKKETDSLKSLKDRIFACKACGIKLDRDYNASINIHRVGTSTLAGEVVRPLSRANFIDRRIP